MYLDDRCDEAAIRHSHCNCHIDVLVVGDALGVRRAGCSSGRANVRNWLSKCEKVRSATGGLHRSMLWAPCLDNRG